MLAFAYLVKHHTVNVENRVRAPESTNQEDNDEPNISATIKRPLPARINPFGRASHSCTVNHY